LDKIIAINTNALINPNILNTGAESNPRTTVVEEDVMTTLASTPLHRNVAYFEKNRWADSTYIHMYVTFIGAKTFLALCCGKSESSDLRKVPKRRERSLLASADTFRQIYVHFVYVMQRYICTYLRQIVWRIKLNILCIAIKIDLRYN
jgi:hypothetical protein